ncbi:MAG: 2-oxoglutarate dehydrogenase E1 component [Bdellovibrionota bacterium]
MDNYFNSIYQSNSGYVDDMFARYNANPNSVGTEWQAFFSGFQQGFASASTLSQNSQHYEQLLTQLANTPKTSTTVETNLDTNTVDFEMRVARFVCAWKKNGHLVAKTNPLSEETLQTPELEYEFYNFTQEEFKWKTKAGILAKFPEMTLTELIQKLKERFGGNVGIEIEHVECAVEKNWLYSELEKIYAPVSKETQKQIYSELAQADALEKTLATKYVGKKRFSIEGADAQIPACQSFITESVNLGAEECTVAIAHRGRLNFLVHVVGKPLEKLLAEWEGYHHDGLVGDCDVKYHYGYESEQQTRNGKPVRVSLPFNPSHLEFVGSVVLGDTRARQQLYYGGDTNKVACMVFHGDAAVAGQGIVYENAQTMTLEGYKIGGSVHVVANNQVGFTTNPSDARSSTYCTDVAKVTNSPVFHVNADNLDALHNVMTLCARYRAQFKKDIYIDLICFRRHGHNEADEPNFTQPGLYKLVKEKPAPYETYMQYLVAQCGFSEDELKEIYNKYRQDMNIVFDKVKAEKRKIEQFQQPRDAGKLTAASQQQMLERADTTFPLNKLKELAIKVSSLPTDFHANSKLARIIIGERAEMAQGNKKIDWGMAELLAYATLLDEGFSIRLSGEDCQRGTFSHRHVTLIDAEDDHKFTSLSTINPNCKVEVINSFLSEEAVMGFEYGFAVRNINCLTLWEAQFGDFANGAQVIIDQFIISGETKWAQQQALVLLLPHGLEGMGAEHSSARLERYLQLCAQGNMQVCYFTTGAQLYHALRRQLRRNFRKPLVVMTPKSFLRSPRASCTLEDLATGTFLEILDDERLEKKNLVEKVLLCSGKIALDLFDALEKDEYKTLDSKVAIIRVEQLFPFHHDKMSDILAQYKNAKIFWVQEEPKNMGAWFFIQDEMQTVLQKNKIKELLYIGRSKRATPAVGLEKLHHIEQDRLIKSALESNKSVEV